MTRCPYKRPGFGKWIQVFSLCTYTKVIVQLREHRDESLEVNFRTFYRWQYRKQSLGYAEGINLRKVLIAGEADKTVNYESAMKKLGVLGETSLHVPDISFYDGLILPGGGDIDPKLFGQLPCGTGFFDPVLDRLQLAILKAFVISHKPVLGICKGMQLINIYFGGDMLQHLKTSKNHAYVQKDQVHMSVAKKRSYLDRLYGERFAVNSAHHQGVDSPGKGIEYVQFAEDGVTEGLRHRFLPIWGVQWHPERMCFAQCREDAVDGSLLLSFFLKTN